MESNTQKVYAKIGLMCGIICILCGIIITILSALDIEGDSSLRLVSGIIFTFTAVGTIYTGININKLK